MPYHRLQLGSPAFILLAITNLLVVLWNASSALTRAADGADELDHRDGIRVSSGEAGPLHGHVEALEEKVRKLARPFSSSKGPWDSLFTHSTTKDLATPILHTQSCEVCVLEPENELCQYGIDNIHLSRAYEGSGHRVRCFLQKAVDGEAVKVGIIGGSVSAGHGLHGGPTWHARWFANFQKQFPKSQLENGAVPAVGADFFSWCYSALIGSDLDLYIIELDINNLDSDGSIEEDDALYRALLDLPHRPAVIRVSVVATSFSDLAQGSTSGLAMSEYWDVPVISVRNILLPHFINHPTEMPRFFDISAEGTPDYRHMTKLGHDALGDMLHLYLQEQLCETRRRLASPPPPSVSPWPKEDILGWVPRLYLWKPYDLNFTAPPVRAQCTFTTSPRAPLVALPAPATTEGTWNRVEWNGKAALVADQVGDQISFEFSGTRVGAFLYMQSGAAKESTTESQPGQAACWVDQDLTGGTLLDNWWDQSIAQPILHEIAVDLTEGDHILHCQIVAETSTGGHELRIMGVAST